MHTGHLNNLDYSVCIQSEPGYCGIAYQQTDPAAFQLSGLADGNVPSPWNGETGQLSHLFIDTGRPGVVGLVASCSVWFIRLL